MSNDQRLPFSTTDHPVLFSSIYTNNDNNESDVRSNSNVNEEVDEGSSSSCSSSNTNRPSTPCFESAKFEDFNVDEEGRLVGLFGVPWKIITVKSLRPLGKSLNVRGYSNFSKKEFINAISVAYINRNMYSTEVDASTRKTRNCTYRLINILFRTSSQANLRQLLTRGQGQNWMRVLHRIIGGSGERYKMRLPENMVYLIRFSFPRMCV